MERKIMRRFAETFAPTIGQACGIVAVWRTVSAAAPAGAGRSAVASFFDRPLFSAPNILRRTSRWRLLAKPTAMFRIARKGIAMCPSKHGSEKLMTMV
jgi:hypothetical protein